MWKPDNLDAPRLGVFSSSLKHLCKEARPHHNGLVEYTNWLNYLGKAT
jgi:hypothetical protein